MTKEEMWKIMERVFVRWLACDPHRPAKKPKYQLPGDKRHMGGHNLLPPMTEEQKKMYRKLKVAGLSRADALGAVGIVETKKQEFD